MLNVMTCIKNRWW